MPTDGPPDEPQPARGVRDIAHDLANAAMLVDGAAGRLGRGGEVTADDLRAVADRLYDLIAELSDQDS